MAAETNRLKAVVAAVDDLGLGRVWPNNSSGSVGSSCFNERRPLSFETSISPKILLLLPLLFRKLLLPLALLAGDDNGSSATALSGSRMSDFYFNGHSFANNAPCRTYLRRIDDCAWLAAWT